MSWSIYCVIYGCTDVTACNFNEDATIDDDSCDYVVPGIDCDNNDIVFDCEDDNSNVLSIVNVQLRLII